MRRTVARSFRGLGVVASAFALLVAMPSVALAGFEEVPDPTWMTNGTVYAIVRSGDHVYIGGQFTRVRSTPPGVKGPTVKSIGIARLDAETGVADKTWTPEVTRSDGKRAVVFAIAVTGGKVFFGGKFDRVDGQPRRNFAAVAQANAALDAGADSLVGSGFGSPIRGMIASSTRVYAAGYFSSVDGQPRAHLAAFDTSGELVDGWTPRTGEHARALAFDCDGDVIAGGAFQTAAGSTGPLVARDKVAVFDETTGALQAWSTRDADLDNGMNVFDLAVSCAGQRLIAGIGGQNWLYAFDLGDDDGEMVWRRHSAGNVQTVAVNDFGTASTADDRIYFGGHFGGGVDYPTGTCSESKPKTARFGVATLDGHCDLSWRPNFEGKFYGPWDILVTDGGARVWVGGQYTQVCDGSQNPAPCVDRYFLSRFTGP
jgi:hypothetical protein